MPCIDIGLIAVTDYTVNSTVTEESEESTEF